jgi:hypothetical protein
MYHIVISNNYYFEYILLHKAKINSKNKI